MDLILHGHFYQPPRENPWTGEIGREPGARPYSDWNQRVDAECYRPNAFGRIVDDAGAIARINNNYAWLSFNFGPTLAAWLARHDPLTLERLRQADRESSRRLGHGNAIAQAYNHVIMPLADARDRATQIRWGLAAFRHLFGREASSLWLPETAASRVVLDDLIDHGLGWVLLAPHQAARVRPPGGSWQDVSGGRIDTSRAYLHRHGDGSGRALAVLFYDGELARAIAFGEALDASASLAARCREAMERAAGPLVSAAFDGETAGHHHAWGDRALAHALVEELPAQGLRLTNPATFLEEHTAEWEVELDEGPDGAGTSWSCAHGVGRWREDCGCRVDGRRGFSQAWRGPLRAAVHVLRDRAADYFQEEAGRILGDPWAARDDYISVLLQPGGTARRGLLSRHGREPLAGDAGERALALLELQHQVMLASTSCGWFFDDIGGLEATQVLRYVAHACDLWAGLGGEPPRSELREILGAARSNVASRGTGADILDRIRARDARRAVAGAADPAPRPPAVAAADVEALRRRVVEELDGRRQLPREIVLHGLPSPPGLAAALAAWQIESILIGLADAPPEIDAAPVLSEARALRRTALGRRGADWLRRSLERAAAVRLAEGDGDRDVGVARMLRAAADLGLHPEHWHRAQEALAARVLAPRAGNGPAAVGPALRAAATALGFAPEWPAAGAAIPASGPPASRPGS